MIAVQQTRKYVILVARDQADLREHLRKAFAADDKVRIALRPENITIGSNNGANHFPARVLDRRYQGTQTAYGIELFGKRLEVIELGTAARHQVGIETQVSLPRESCWAYRDTGPVSHE